MLNLKEGWIFFLILRADLSCVTNRNFQLPNCFYGIKKEFYFPGLTVWLNVFIFIQLVILALIVDSFNYA